MKSKRPKSDDADVSILRVGDLTICDAGEPVRLGLNSEFVSSLRDVNVDDT